MSDSEAPASKSSTTKAATSKPTNNGTHPTYAQMVMEALNMLEKRRQGQSLQAIKSYIGGKYSIDIEKTKRFINQYLHKAVEEGIIVKVKGSFKLPSKQSKKANGDEDAKNNQKETKTTAAESVKKTKKIKPMEKSKSAESIGKMGTKKTKVGLTVKRRSSVAPSAKLLKKSSEKKSDNQKPKKKVSEKKTEEQKVLPTVAKSTTPKKVKVKPEKKVITSDKKVAKNKKDNTLAG